MSEIKGFARLKIHPGKLQEFKDLQAQCMAVVRAKDTGTLQYEVFFNDDSSECIEGSPVRIYTPYQSL